MVTHFKGRMMLLAALALATGCRDESDARLAWLAEQSIEAQARQNEEMARQSRQVAEASQALVEADAQARRELVETHASLQEGLHEERATLDERRDHLERDRREVARQRRTDPLIASAIMAVGVLLACIAPLALAGYVVYTANRPDSEADAMNELLVAEFVSEQPILLPRASPSPPQLAHPSPRSIAAPDQPDDDSDEE
ncbi:MAG: hypothetical protein KY475_16770 [Planctomycetes bacterium]|nr:hypothetical protein [Planctomycetota bacterium]